MTGRLLLCLFALLSPVLLYAQAADTTAPATVQAVDSAAVVDSSYRMQTPVFPGTLDRFLDSAKSIERRELPWIEHRFLGDILMAFPGVFLADQQSEGQYSRLSVRGSDWRSIAVMRDGRLLNEPASGVYNLYGFTTEHADRIEMISGPRAFVYGLNSTGAAVNLVTRNYSSNRPLSGLAYSESGYNYSRTDGFFSQNISHTLNITAGFQAQSTDGRFPNALDEQWNSRVKLRYNPFQELQVIFSHSFTHTSTGLNGGVDILASGGTTAFDPLQAVMVNTDAYEKVTRHDVDLSLIGTFLGDSANTSTLTLYYSHQLREYRDEENRFFANGLFLQSDHTSSWAGLTLKQIFVTGLQRFQAGASGELRQVEGSPNIGRRRNSTGSVWGIEELVLGEGTQVAGFGRLEQYLHGTYGGIGADARIALLPWLTASGGISHSRRLPTYQELYWTGDSVTRSHDIRAERHLVAEAGFDLRPDSLTSMSVAWFHRTVVDPIMILATGGSGVLPTLEFTNAGKVRTMGIESAFRIRIWVLTLEGVGTWVIQKDENGARLGTLPRLSGQSGLYYWNDILNGNLTIKAGFRGRYQSAAAGERFIPELAAYVPNTLYEPGRGSAVDFLLFARIGNAHIHFLWTNLTGARYFTTPFYPARDREIRFGLTWQFLD